MLNVNADKIIENGTYVIESALDSNKVLDVQGAKTDNKIMFSYTKKVKI